MGRKLRVRQNRLIAHYLRNLGYAVYEMEQVLPDGDPIIQSNDLKDRGDFAGAQRMLMQLLDADLRCLDAHAHLGNLVFDHRHEDAIKHYEIGMRIGELSLGANFDGVLSWGWIDNRPFLRCRQARLDPACQGRARD